MGTNYFYSSGCFNSHLCGGPARERNTKKIQNPRENKNIHFSFINTATPRQTKSKTNKALFLATLNLTLRNEKVGNLEIINKETTATHAMTQIG